MNPNEIADAIGYPLDKWGGHCYSVFAAFLAADVLDGARPVTGYYDDGTHVTDHAWLKLPGGRICDPTRFWLEDKTPYIFIGKPDQCYDERGVRWNRYLAEIRMKFVPDYPDLVAAFNRLQKAQERKSGPSGD